MTTHNHHEDHHTNALLLHVADMMAKHHGDDSHFHGLREAAKHEHARHAAAHAAMHPHNDAAAVAAEATAALVAGGV